MYLQPVEHAYIAVGVADAEADARECGFATTFGGKDYFFFVVEAGVGPKFASQNGPLQGMYRVGVWYDPQDKDRLDGDGTEADDAGVYVSMC